MTKRGGGETDKQKGKEKDSEREGGTLLRTNANVRPLTSQALSHTLGARSDRPPEYTHTYIDVLQLV
jgi:hypothetical protein